MRWPTLRVGVVQYVASGRLREVMPDYPLPSAHLSVYYVSRPHRPAKVRALIDRLAAEFSP